MSTAMPVHPGDGGSDGWGVHRVQYCGDTWQLGMETDPHGTLGCFGQRVPGKEGNSWPPWVVSCCGSAAPRCYGARIPSPLPPYRCRERGSVCPAAPLADADVWLPGMKGLFRRASALPAPGKRSRGGSPQPITQCLSVLGTWGGRHGPQPRSPPQGCSRARGSGVSLCPTGSSVPWAVRAAGGWGDWDAPCAPSPRDPSWGSYCPYAPYSQRKPVVPSPYPCHQLLQPV